MGVVHLYHEDDFLVAARKTMNYYGLRDWELIMNSETDSLGQCHYKRMALEFSDKHMPNVNRLVRQDVVLHEVAHALAGVEAGHGREWRNVARSIGCTALEVIETKKFVNKEIYYTWIGTCPKGHRIGSHFKPKGMEGLSCPKCSPDGWHYAFRYTWTKHGAMVFDPALDEMALSW